MRHLLKNAEILFFNGLIAGYFEISLNPQCPLFSKNKADGCHPLPDSQTTTPVQDRDCNKMKKFPRCLLINRLTSQVSFLAGIFRLRHLKPALHLFEITVSFTVLILPFLSSPEATHVSRLVSALQGIM